MNHSHTVFIICAEENDFRRKARRNQFGHRGRGTGDTNSVDLLQNRKVLEVVAHASCVHCVSLLVLYTNCDISQRLRYSKRVKPVWIYKFGPVSTGTHSLVWPFKRHANALNPTGWAVVLFLYNTSSSFASAYKTVSSIMAEYYVYVVN